MNIKGKFYLLTLLTFLLISSTINAQGVKSVEKSFEVVEKLSIDLVLGSCEIIKSADQSINIRVEYSYDDEEYEVFIDQRGKRVSVEENFHENDPRGESRWYIEIPDDLDVRFETATGNLSLHDVKIVLDANSGTGNIIIKNSKGDYVLNSGTGNLLLTDCTGKFDLNSGTGNVEMKDCSGEFDANSGTGDVDAKNIVIEHFSSFNSGTGDAEVKLSEEAKDDLEISSGTGDALLDYGNVELKGTFYFKCKERSGRIICPVDFDDETVERKGGDYVEKKYFRRGDGPRIKISTGTGTAELISNVE